MVHRSNHHQACWNLNPRFPPSAQRLVRVLADLGLGEAKPPQLFDPVLPFGHPVNLCVHLWRRLVLALFWNCWRVFGVRL